MSLLKAILHHKEKRDARKHECTCYHKGKCQYCRNRQADERRKEEWARRDLREWQNGAS